MTCSECGAEMFLRGTWTRPVCPRCYGLTPRKDNMSDETVQHETRVLNDETIQREVEALSDWVEATVGHFPFAGNYTREKFQESVASWLKRLLDKQTTGA